MTPPEDAPPDRGPFDEEACDAARKQHVESHFRWLALSDDEEARELRWVLQACWERSGTSRDTLRKGLMHERWGQHIGALAQLLALGLFLREGYHVESEPDLGRQSPDMLVTREGSCALVEVRAITGCGDAPWTRPHGGAPRSVTPPRSAEGGRRSSAAAERDARARARRWAAERAKAEKALAKDLRDSVAGALERKAAAYRDLAESRGWPYVICVYEDTDSKIGSLACDWAFGPAVGGDRSRRAGGAVSDADREPHHSPDGGAFSAGRARLDHVSALLVFGREDGRARLRGDVIRNPFARRPLPEGWVFPHLREYRVREDGLSALLDWAPYHQDPFEVVPQA